MKPRLRRQNIVCYPRYGTNQPQPLWICSGDYGGEFYIYEFSSGERALEFFRKEEWRRR